LVMTFLNQRGNVSWQNPKTRFAATSEICDGYGLFRVLHSVHRGVESSEKKCLPHLTYFSLIVRLQMVRHFLKVWDRAGDSQSGLKYSKEQIL
jgi:hypothetical protein